MSRKGILIVAVLFGVAIMLLALATRGYREVEAFQSLEKAEAAVRHEFPKVVPISTDELAVLLVVPERALLVDAREAEEYAVSHLAGALHLTSVEEVSLALAARTTPPELIVVYDSVGFRSAKLAEALAGEVIPPVRSLSGGFFLWSNEGRELVDALENPTDRVHPYNRMWGRLLKAR